MCRSVVDAVSRGCILAVAVDRGRSLDMDVVAPCPFLFVPPRRRSAVGAVRLSVVDVDEP